MIKIFTFILLFLLSLKSALAINSGSYLPIDPSNFIDLNKTNELSNELKFIDTSTNPLRGVGQEIFKNAAPATAIIVAEEGIGSGFLINADGNLVTNFHVIETSNNSYSKDIKVAFCPLDPSQINNAKVFQAHTIKVDKKRDLALLKLNSPVDFSISKIVKLDTNLSSVMIGMDVHAIGHPDGGSYCTYTKGVVSQFTKNHKWTYDDNNYFYADVIQTQTPINPGNSGGPLLNDNGDVIGINTFIMRDVIGINFAVAASDIDDFIKNSPEEKKQNWITKEEKQNWITKKCSNDEQFVEELDLNKNGIKDSTTYDTDCNGILDLIEYDSNEDGIVDNMILDSNENGIPDIIVTFEIHTDGDYRGEKYAKYDIDTNEDDIIENVCIDYDLDGEIDYCEQ